MIVPNVIVSHAFACVFIVGFRSISHVPCELCISENQFNPKLFNECRHSLTNRKPKSVKAHNSPTIIAPKNALFTRAEHTLLE